MRNLIYLLAIVIIGLTSCEGPMGPEGPRGPQGHQGSVNLTTISYTVKEQDWILVGNPDEIGSYYEYIFDEPYITSDLFEFGLFIGYKFYHIGDLKVQTELPFTVYDIEETPNGEHHFSTQFMYDVNPGQIAFKVIYSDFYTAPFPPKTHHFRVMYIW